MEANLTSNLLTVAYHRVGLGPLILISYINDLSMTSDTLFSILFVADTSVFIEGESLDEAVLLLNSELKQSYLHMASANMLILIWVKCENKKSVP